jgi:hypothetical protein
VRHFDNGRGVLQFYLTAFTVLMSAFVGVEGDEVGVKKKTETTVQTGPSSSPTSTATAPS